MASITDTAKKERITSVILITAFFLLCFPGCKYFNRQAGASAQGLSFENISLRDIPGVTADEINMIEAVLTQRQYFSYVMLPGTDSFLNADGEIRGFSALVCEWLSSLFGIPFVLSHSTWNELIDGLRTGEVDFTNDLTPTYERRQIYFMTDAIAHRPVLYFRLSGSESLSDIAAVRTPRYGILQDTTTIQDVIRYAIEEFELVLVASYEEAYELLKTGDIDAYIVESVAETAFDVYGDVVTSIFLPLIYSTISFTTQNPELAPFISVLQKILDNGGIHFLNDLSTRGHREYLRNKFIMRLNNEEREYLSANPIIRFMAEYDNYPVNFYNTREKQWQGISFDVLRHVENLTGLEFKIINDPQTEWFEILQMLENGDIPMVPELTRSIDREGRFIWPRNNYIRNQSMLISKEDYPDIRINEVMTAKVGLSRGTVYSEMFQRWFPEHRNFIMYDSNSAALEALMYDKVDMIMGSAHSLLYMMHFLEFPNYKANIVFDGADYESTFGFNKNEAVLCSIIDKSLDLIDTRNIMDHWLRKSYDYRIKVAQAQRPWMIGAVITLAVILALLFIIYLNDKVKRKIIADQAAADMANRAKSEFLATMSHEIRTPMNSIMGFAELAADLAVVPKVKDFLGKIIDSTKWLLHIINDILDISKIEAGKMELDRTPFDLRDVFSRCQSVILPSVKEKGLDLSIYAEPSIGKKLIGDPLRLYQVIMNLLSNAVKFTNIGTVKLSSSIKNVDDNKTTVYFEVKDTGLGMTPEQIGRIFDLFTQADSSTTRNFGGTGLGLPIAKNIVELMGGELLVESTFGIGSTFSFELTFETIDAPEGSLSRALSGAYDREKFEIPERPYFEGLVLICDDNSLNQQVICAHLDRVGLKTVTAENGKIGVDIVRERKEKHEKPFDLIFMDMFMPVMDGMEAASRIMALDTGTPIVVMTANVMVSELEKYRRSGMPDCLGKPFTSQELWYILLKYLNPVSSESISGPIDEREENEGLQKKLRLNFFRDNQTIHTRILEAIAAGDTKLAHRLAHSLKGNAGLIGKTALRSAAAEVEALLKDGTASVWENKMNNLISELTLVLYELKPLLDDAQGQGNDQTSAAQRAPAFNAEQALALFEKLRPMLENINPESASMLDEIRAVPGTDDLVRQIENYDFESAARTLVELKKKLVSANFSYG